MTTATLEVVQRIAAETLKKSNECPVCGGAMRRVLELPRYPLTEMYEPWEPAYEDDRGLVDQALLLCEPCSHGKLETVVPPHLLYGSAYRTRTAKSSGATNAVWRFANFIKEHVSLDRVDMVIDIGGNDGEFAAIFQDKRTVIVDPCATPDASDICIAEPIESADLSHLRGARKLIVSSHTLEHIERPEAFLKKVADTLCHDEYVALQFPSLDLLVRDARIDHIHHQHIHYYSQRSISILLARHGMEIVAWRYDHEHYGALMVLARRGKGETPAVKIFEMQIVSAKELFDAKRAHLCQLAWRYPRLVAFGAALMLPVLVYYMPYLDGCVDFIADNDRSKDGLRYVNFNKRIKADYDLHDRNVIVTGIATREAARSLTAEAFRREARNVIVPLHAL